MTYITLETALRMIGNAYLVSVVLLLGVSYIGFSIVEALEKGGSHSPKAKWFS